MSIGYTLFGGLYSVAYTDVIQLICMMIGLSLAIFVVIFKNDISISEAFNTENLPPNFPTFSDFQTELVFVPENTTDYLSFKTWAGSVKPSKVASFIDKYLLCLMGGLPWQVYFQRVLSCDTPENAQILSFVGSFGCLVMIVPAMIVGFIARVVDWAGVKSYTDYLYGQFVKEFPEDVEFYKEVL